jgi:high-affinity Fe2+/Pb2+ permease
MKTGDDIRVAMRVYWEGGALVVVGGLALYGWWRLRRRSWSASTGDEAMRRHVNQNYS